MLFESIILESFSFSSISYTSLKKQSDVTGKANCLSSQEHYVVQRFLCTSDYATLRECFTVSGEISGCQD